MVISDVQYQATYNQLKMYLTVLRICKKQRKVRENLLPCKNQQQITRFYSRIRIRMVRLPHRANNFNAHTLSMEGHILYIINDYYTTILVT